MLISFAVSNYKSFKNEQIFSMQKDTSIDSEKYAFIYNSDEPGLSCVAAIYGANAAGKSNFLQAFANLYDIIIRGEGVNTITKFIGNKTDVTTYNVVFIGKNNKKYVYSLDISADGIQYEILSVYNSTQPITIFEWDASTGVKPDLNKKYFTKEERTAVAYNVSSYNTAVFYQLSKIKNEDIYNAYDFFANGLLIHGDMGLGKRGDGAKISVIIQKSPDIHRMLNALLPAADLGIQGVELVEEDSSSNIKQQEILDNAIIAYMEASDQKPTEEQINNLKKSLSKKVLEAVFKHKIGNESVNFSTSQESDGTIAASSIFMDLLPVLSQGAVYIVDELDRSLHPAIVAQIVRIFNHKETNPYGAQLIFTTHDTSLLDSSIHEETLLDRDEVWFVEKNVDGESEIYPLTSIKYTTTKNSNIYRKYIEGRYGATPRASITTAIASYWRDQNAKTTG